MMQNRFENTEGKCCTKCGQLGEFYKGKHYKDGLTSWCAECMKAASAMRRRTHPEKVRASYRAWEKANPEKKAENLKRWKKNNPEKVKAAAMVVTQRRRARLAGMASTLTTKTWREILEYFGYACAYCLRTDKKLSIDHIQPVSKGGATTPENVVPACLPCNISKHNHSIFHMLNVS